MNSAYKLSFLSVLAVLFLLPIFFLPASILPLGTAKVAFLALGAIVALIALLMELLKKGQLELPSHWLMWAVIVLPVVYFVTALTGTDKARSLLGYNMEVGTFGYMLIASALLGVTAYVFSDTARVIRGLSAFFISFSLVALFAVAKILSGGSFPVWGTFGGNMANPVGAWTDYAVVFALLAVVSGLAISVLPVRKALRIFLYVVFGLSVLLATIINFQAAFIFMLGAAIVMMVYMYTVEKRLDDDHKKVTYWPAVALAIVGLLFIINPVVSSTRGQIGTWVSSSFGVNNAEVRPSLGTTMGITKSVLKERPFFGSGPNTFDKSWLMHKPQAVNTTAFWNTAFPFGFGFIPTQFATTGVLGIVAWVLFLVMFALLGVRVFAHMPAERWSRFSVISTFMASLFLWAASILYVPSIVVLTLAFIFTGLFVGAARGTGVINSRVISFSHRTSTNFLAVLLIIALGIGAIALGFGAFQRTVSAYHFQKALVMSNTAGSSVDDIETELAKAIRLVPQDIYYSSLAQLNVARAQAVVNATEGTPEENLQRFQTAISNSIAAAQAAVSLNPGNYRNWLDLGTIYASLVPAPFKVEGAYESAQAAYGEAKKRNPSSPEIPLLQARLELDRGNADQARTHINESLALKQDYAEAYFLLTQLEVSQNNTADAIRSAESAAILSPENPGIFFQLGLLKYTNNDFNGAIEAFSLALRILPDYANAKYFLGLALSKTGRTDQAIAQFEDLVKTNPDNAELPLILANLRAGRDPLFEVPGANPPPEDRDTPPITTSTTSQ